MSKVKITLIDINHAPKPDKTIRKQYPISEALEAGAELCKEFGYDTFKFQKVITKRKTATKKSKKSS